MFFSGCLLKYVRICSIAIVSAFLSFYPLPARADPAASSDSVLETLIASSFAGTYKTQVAKEGSDLQYLARTFYGVQLGWPLVWYFNVESIPDPERIKAGTEIKIPRLKNGLDEKAAFEVLESAYILAYKRYLSLANRSDGQRRWVLTQAVEAGCDLTGAAWNSVLTEPDQAWSESRGIKVAVKKTVPLVVAAEPLLVADLVGAAANSDESTLGVLAAKFDKAGKLDDVIADLETKATAAEAPPEVFLALSILYGRKGLKTKEYAALAAAETAAARPGVKFNVAVVYGRKQLLAGAPDAESFMVGSLEFVSTPAGAIVFVDGVRMGATPLVVDKVKAGVRRIRLEADGYKSSESELAVDVGAEIPLSVGLAPKPGSIMVTTNPPGALVWLDKWTEYAQNVPTPYVFENITPGEHSITIDNQLIENKYYLDNDPIPVVVLPGKQASVEQLLVRGSGSLQLTGFPENCTVTLDGLAVDAASVFGSGYHTDAGRYQLKVSAPTGQKWTSTIVIKEDISFDRSLGIISTSLARKTIKMDGKTDDWTGLLPVWINENHSDPFPIQSGTKMSAIYMCRDKNYLYWRIDFSDGSPTTKLSKDIKQQLYYNTQIFVNFTERITMYIAFERDKGSRTWANIFSTKTNKSTNVTDNCITYKIGESTLEARISLGMWGSKLSEGALQTVFDIVNADIDGTWFTSLRTDEFKVDYYE